MAEDMTTRKRGQKRRGSSENLSLEDFSPTERALLTIVAGKKECSPKDVMAEGIRYFLQETVKVEVGKNGSKI